MSSWTHGAQANKMSHFSTTRTLSDFPLLISEMLRRGVGRFELALASAEVFSRHQFTKHGRRIPVASQRGLFRGPEGLEAA